MSDSYAGDGEHAAHRPPATTGLPGSLVPSPGRLTWAGPPDAESALADGFARRLGALARGLGASPQSIRWAMRAAAAVSRATADGHVCVALEEFVGSGGAASAAALGTARALLLASGVACTGGAPAGALLPLVIDAHDRVYLARYYDYERRLAWSLAWRAQAADGMRPAAAEADAGSQTEADAAPGPALAGLLDRYFTPAGPGEVDAQRLAAALALTGRLTIVSGGPGTGKTTTVVGMLAALLDRQPALRIALAAPTGKAAQRLQEALRGQAGHLPPALAARLPTQSQTLHRLLGIGPDGTPRYHRGAPLPYDVVIVDEASMIDVALAARLADAVAANARLVLLGDQDQLAAVEAGAVFAELSARQALSAQRLPDLALALGVPAAVLAGALTVVGPADAEANADAGTAQPPPAGPAVRRATAPGALLDCVVWLQRNYRFGLDSPIGRLAVAIRQGSAAGASAALTVLDASSARAGPAAGSPEPLAGTAAAILFEDSGAALGPAALARLADGFAHYTAALSAWLERRDAGASGGPPEGTAGDLEPLFAALNRFCVLCAVRAGARGADQLNVALAALVRRAAGVTAAPGAHWFAGRVLMIKRNDYALGLFNGDVGIALPGAAGALRIWLRAPGGGFRAVAMAALPAHDTAFALTVHKAQGSEFEHVALVLPAIFNRVLSRELIYTAVTRARSKVTLFGAAALVDRAVATPTRRASGLAARLDEAAAKIAAGRR